MAHAQTADTANSAQTADTANSAGNANTLGGQDPAAFQTASASAEGQPQDLSSSNKTVVSTAITIPSQKTLTAVGSLMKTGNAVQCNLEIAGTDGVAQTTGSGESTLSLTQSQSVAAGTHTVLAECNDMGAGGTDFVNGSLSVVATG